MKNDLISRQAAINAIENTKCKLLPVEWDELTDAIKAVPSAQPEETTIEESEEEKTERLEKTLKPCPFCGGDAHIMRMGYPHYIYCDHCGAKIHGREMGPKAEEASVNAWNSRWSTAPELPEEITKEMKWIVKETIEAERRILELARVIGDAIHTALKSEEFSEAIRKITEQAQREVKE